MTKSKNTIKWYIWNVHCISFMQGQIYRKQMLWIITLCWQYIPPTSMIGTKDENPFSLAVYFEATKTPCILLWGYKNLHFILRLQKLLAIYWEGARTCVLFWGYKNSLHIILRLQKLLAFYFEATKSIRILFWGY